MFLRYNKILIIFLFGLFAPSLILISELNDDYELKILFLFLSLLIVFLLLILFIKETHIIYVKNNLTLCFLFIAFSHTFFRFTIFPITFGLEYNHTLVTAILFLFVAVIDFFSNESKAHSYGKNKQRSALIILTFSSLFSSVLVNYGDFLLLDGVSKLIIFFLSLYYFCKFIPSKIIENSKVADIFIFLLFSVGTIASVVGLITVVEPYINPVNEAPGASISFFTHPNANAFLYCYSIPCGIYLFFKYYEKMNVDKKLILVFAILIAVANQILTYNRSGLIAVLFGMLVFIYYYNKKLFAVFLIVLPFAVLLLYQITTAEKGASTVVGRVGLISTGIEMLVNSRKGFLWGFGIENNFKVFEETKSFLLFQEEHNYPHNSFLFFILEFGIITFILVMTFLFKVIFSSLVRFFKKKLDHIELLSLSIVISVLIQSIFEDFVLFPQFYLFHLFLIFLGVLVIANKENVKHNFEKLN